MVSCCTNYFWKFDLTLYNVSPSYDFFLNSGPGGRKRSTWPFGEFNSLLGSTVRALCSPSPMGTAVYYLLTQDPGLPPPCKGYSTVTIVPTGPLTQLLQIPKCQKQLLWTSLYPCSLPQPLPLVAEKTAKRRHTLNTQMEWMIDMTEMSTVMHPRSISAYASTHLLSPPFTAHVLS